MKAAFLALLLTPAALAGQEPRDPRSVRPERPTVATHAYPVAPGILEIETGVEFDRFDDRSHAVFAPTNLKLGLAARAQLNVYLPLTAPSGASLGIGDVGAGVKWQLLEGDPVLGSFAVLPAFKLASGDVSAGRGTGTTDVSLTLISSRALGPVSVDLNVAGTLRSGDGTTVPKHATLWTASFGIPVSGRLNWALELFGYPATSGPAGTEAYSAVLTGPTLVGRRLAVDAGVIVPFAGRQTFGLYAGAVWNAARLWTSARRLPNP